MKAIIYAIYNTNCAIKILINPKKQTKGTVFTIQIVLLKLLKVMQLIHD